MAPKFRVVLAVLLLVAAPMVVFAQARLTAADIEGTISDESGAVLPGVTVTATNNATNQSRTSVTGKDGRYYIGAIQPGTYTMQAELAGFAPQQRKDVRLVIGQLADIHFTLRPGTSEAI
ncbi:MAG: carboxypeptidase regulatory-like domain-containing protein, partial [Thermoanaerobaculia bacterium]|nr:carboxypeptidase regulatory-like domain-containing protein [Thermoanaerobaculia bacterium]